MSKTLSVVRGLVRSYLDEASQSDWKDTELNSLVNAYYHKVRSRVINIYEDYYITTASFNSVANQEEYGSVDGVPTNIFKIRRVEVNFDVTSSSGAPTRMFPIPNLDAVNRDLGYKNAGIGLKVFGNAFYYTYGFESNLVIGFIPMPSNPGGSGTNAVKLWYVKEQTDMVNDSDTLDLPYVDEYYLNVVYGAVAEGLRFGSQDLQGAKELDLKYEQANLKMEEELTERIAQDAKTVVDSMGDNLNFDSPY